MIGLLTRYARTQFTSPFAPRRDSLEEGKDGGVKNEEEEEEEEEDEVINP